MIEIIGLCTDSHITTSKTVFLITFGNGSAQYSSKAPADYNFTTHYFQNMNNPWSLGMFAFLNSVPSVYFGWHGGALDHTIDDSGGYMLFVDVDKKGDYIFNYKINNLCVGLSYEFSAYFANPIKKGINMNLPNILLEVRALKEDGELIATTSTGNLSEHDIMTWSKHGVSFIAHSSIVVLRMISNTAGLIGNDVVIDDIELLISSTDTSTAASSGK